MKDLPLGIELVAAAKTRTPAEIQEAVNAGINIIGENYVQEAEPAFELIGNKVRWHFIGHLQKNKIKKAVRIFDMIETVDSYGLAKEIDKRCGDISKVMPVLVEVNSARENQKSGVLPQTVVDFIKDISDFKNIKISGLMTMGPWRDNPQDLRPYFRETKYLFDEIKTLGVANADIKYLSMGMTDSYKIAIEEGANVVRIGTLIFGQR